MPSDFESNGKNAKAPFTLRVHRGDGMALLAMNWKKGKPPRDFVGFGIEFRPPGAEKFLNVLNRINFPNSDGTVSGERRKSLESPIQKFRWVNFPAMKIPPGEFTYRVTAMFMDSAGNLRAGESQSASIELNRETCPGQMNVTFTRGFIASQAFVNQFDPKGDAIKQLLPSKSSKGLEFVPTHPRAKAAYEWMGFEARGAILDLLDQAISEDKKAQVRVVAYDLNQPEIVERLEKLKDRLKVIIDDSGEHHEAESAESIAAQRLMKSAGKDHVKRQHLGQLQHNKTIIVDGPKIKAAIGGSTNFTWRGMYVQNNHAVVVQGQSAIAPFHAAFEQYWSSDTVSDFGGSPAALWNDFGLKKLDARVSFSPHSKNNALLQEIADDILTTKSSLFYSLAFLYQTKGTIRDAIEEVTNRNGVFVYGVSDKKVGGLQLLKPDGNLAPVRPESLSKNVPEPFKSEPTGGGGNRMHHKFVVIDFGLPSARVYFGSYNFSGTADTKNGENLFCVRDRRVAVSFAIEALRIFDHYHFRVTQAEGQKARKQIALQLPPQAGETAWWEPFYTDPIRIRDRELFS
jgi:hypothetical protein